MKVKAFEIRDKGTFIPALGILMEPDGDVERWLLRRAGFSAEPSPSEIASDVILCRMEASGTNRNATYDPFSWNDRTMHAAHHYICSNWHDLESGAVIDVEFILKETPVCKLSERESIYE